MKKFLAPVALVIVPFMADAQDVPFTCSTHGLQHLAPFLQGHPERVQEIQAAETALENHTAHFAATFDDRGSNAYVIPLVFHIIHEGGVENISDEQVEDAVRILNDDYNKLNADWDDVKAEFLPIVADVGITFRLAGYDPDGNCTSGITRTFSDLTNDGGQDMKNLIQWPRDKYLNIWVSASAQGAAGYTQTPGNVDGFWGEAADGIVILHNYVGSIGTSSVSHSRALTHEVGHWINLKHCWGGTNDPALPENCDMDDSVTDTPNTIGWTSCNRNGATCGSPLDNVENYMEYSYCSKMFTNGQKVRMLAALNSSTADRNNLWSTQNLQATGTTDVQPLCAAVFTADKRSVCAGDQITFTDHSYHGVTGWQWSFTGADPAVSQDAQPVVTYNTPGVYPVELTVTNGIDNETGTQTGYITVLPAAGEPSPYVESFESMSALDPSTWMVNNPDGDAGMFSLSTSAGYTGTHSLRMKNNNITAGRVDEIMSSPIDLSGDASITMSFRYAFARRTADNDDLLRVYVSRDCGETWVLRRQLKGTAELPTVADQTAEFTPSNPSQWEQCVITTISNTYLVPDFRFKFWFQGNGGNNLWLDDININGELVGLEEFPATPTIGLNVLPNPATDAAMLVSYLPEAGDTRVELLDVTGRTVRVLATQHLASGNHRWELPVGELSDGLYTVRVAQNGQRQVTRFVKK